MHNVIIRNLTFRNATDDSINVQMFSHHVWIDHNDLAQGYDGLIDIKRGSSYVTVSWNHTHHHTKNMLLGHDDGNGAQDIGRLKVTYHHNWFDQTPQRNPRVRFGEPVHVYNNYYVYNTDVGVACQANARLPGRGQLLRERRGAGDQHATPARPAAAWPATTCSSASPARPTAPARCRRPAPTTLHARRPEQREGDRHRRRRGRQDRLLT